MFFGNLANIKLTQKAIETMVDTGKMSPLVYLPVYTFSIFQNWDKSIQEHVSCPTLV